MYVTFMILKNAKKIQRTRFRRQYLKFRIHILSFMICIFCDAFLRIQSVKTFVCNHIYSSCNLFSVPWWNIKHSNYICINCYIQCNIFIVFEFIYTIFLDCNSVAETLYKSSHDNVQLPNFAQFWITVSCEMELLFFLVNPFTVTHEKMIFTTHVMAY